MERTERMYVYELRVVQEAEGPMFLAMRDLANARIVIDARFPRNDRTLVLEIDTQTGRCVVRSAS